MNDLKFTHFYDFGRERLDIESVEAGEHHDAAIYIKLGSVMGGQIATIPLSPSKAKELGEELIRRSIEVTK